MTDIGNVGFGITISKGGTLIGEIVDVNYDGLEVKAVDISHNGITDNHMRFIASKLKNPGKLEVDINFDPDDEPIIGGSNESIVITFPLPTAGGVTGATMTCDGFISAFKSGLPMDDKMTGKLTIQFSGQPVWSDHTN